jgi:hypothetical protein
VTLQFFINRESLPAKSAFVGVSTSQLLLRLKQQFDNPADSDLRVTLLGLGFKLIAVTQINSVLAPIPQRARLLRFVVVHPH